MISAVCPCASLPRWAPHPMSSLMGGRQEDAVPLPPHPLWAIITSKTTGPKYAAFSEKRGTCWILSSRSRPCRLRPGKGAGHWLCVVGCSPFLLTQKGDAPALRLARRKGTVIDWAPAPHLELPTWNPLEHPNSPERWILRPL